jgi:leucine efflux protein
MLNIQNYTSFILAILVFQLIPGPGTIAILTATARNGIAAGMAAVCGTLLGDLLYMLAACAGLATIMRSSPVLFNVLQWGGATYLCWMGLQLLRSQQADASECEHIEQSPWPQFLKASAVSLTNPKVILFFVGFFPLFLRPEASALTMSGMIAHVTLLSFAYQTSLVLVGNTIAMRLQAWPSARTFSVRIGGITLIGFGAKLAATCR